MNRAEHHCTEEEWHKGCPKDPKSEPGSYVQQQDVQQVQQEEDMVGLHEPHPLHCGPQFSELINQLFLWKSREGGAVILPSCNPTLLETRALLGPHPQIAVFRMSIILVNLPQH